MAKAICSIDGCERPTRARGWCHTHYQHWRVTGDPVVIRPTFAERMWSKFIRIEGGCWVWTAANKGNGYGHFAGTTAHRAMYELIVGPVDAEIEVDHLCRNPPCVNPSHLEPVTQAVNQQRGVKGALKTHCAQGHPWTAENIRFGVYGRRFCRECKRAYDRRRYLARTRDRSPAHSH